MYTEIKGSCPISEKEVSDKLIQEYGDDLSLRMEELWEDHWNVELAEHTDANTLFCWYIQEIQKYVYLLVHDETETTPLRIQCLIGSAVGGGIAIEVDDLIAEKRLFFAEVEKQLAEILNAV